MHTNHTIISIWVLMAMAYTQTPGGCTEYCNLLLSDELRPFWRPDCVCALEYQRTYNRHKKPTKIKRHSSLDNSAIYYEPSDEYHYHRASFVDYPFYIVNPKYHTQNIQNTENRKARKIAVNNLDRDKELIRSFRKRLPTDNVLRKFDTEAENSPLYLDIDIYKSVQNERSNYIKENNVKRIGLTEDDLIECIDLQVLVFSRKNDQGAVTDLKDMLDIAKINKYKDLTDSDLMIEIQSKCHQPTKIINENLRQIKKTWPRKSVIRSSQNIETIENQKNDRNENKNVLINVTEASTQSYSTTEMVIYSDRELGNILLPSIKERANHSAVKRFNETTSEIIKSNQERFVVDFKNNNMNSEKEIDLQKDSLYQNSNNFLTVTLESTTMVDSLYTNFVTVANNPIKTQTDLVLTDYTTTKPVLRDHHIAINEKDIKIPRIITKEIENSTVVSNINGIELIPNNDFLETTIINQDLTYKYTYETTTTSFGSAEKVIFYDLLKNTSKDSLDAPYHFRNQNGKFKSGEDLKINKAHHHVGQPTELSSEFEIYDSSIRNYTEPNESIVGNKLLLLNYSTVQNNENKQKETGHLISQHGSTKTQVSNEVQTIIPEIFTFLPEIHDNSSLESNSQTIQQTDNNKHLEEETRHITSQVTADTSLDFLSLNTSDKNEASQNLTTSRTFTNSKKINTENSTKFSTVLDLTPESEVFNDTLPKTIILTNHTQVDQALFILNKTFITSEGETNYSMNQDFSLTTGAVDYLNTTEKIEVSTQYYSGHSVSSEFVLYPSILNTTLSKAIFITPSSQDILSKNKTHGLSYSATTEYDPRSSDTSVISITDRTENIKEDILFDLTSQNIVGKLYFLFGEKQVPARFVQDSDGQINLGFDGETICNKLTQKDSNNSVIIEAICNCSRTKNCTKIS